MFYPRFYQLNDGPNRATDQTDDVAFTRHSSTITFTHNVTTHKLAAI